VVSTPLKNISQIGSSSQLLREKKCSKPPTRYTNQQQKWVSNPSTLGISHTVSFPTGILRIPVPVGALETHELWNDYSSGVDIRKTDYLD
jgi:hypothetical protein